MAILAISENFNGLNFLRPITYNSQLDKIESDCHASLIGNNCFLSRYFLVESKILLYHSGTIIFPLSFFGIVQTQVMCLELSAPVMLVVMSSIMLAFMSAVM